MREMITNVSGVIVPVLLCVLVGYALAKLKLPFENKVIGSLVSTVGYPTLVISHLAGQHIELGLFLDILAASLAVVACFGVIGFLILKLLRLPVRAFLSPMMLNNTGNIGLPVCALAFGDEGLALAMGFVVVVLVGMVTIGIWLPMGKLSFGDLFKQPVIYAVVLALLLMATDSRLPQPVDEAFNILGGLTIPLMLLTLGHTLATLDVGALWRGFALAVLHLLMAAAVALVLSDLFALQGVARGVFIVQCMMPVAVATYIWIERYDPDEAPAVAGFIMISTMLSILVLPLVLTFWV